MFHYCNKLNEINLSSFDFNKATDMQCMFKRCSSLKNINFSKNITINETSINDDYLKEELNISNFNEHKFMTMKEIFSECRALEELDLSNFNFNKVSDMSYMFYNCSSLKNLKIPDFDTKKDINNSYMFYGCDSLNNYNNLIWKFNRKRIIICWLIIFFVILCLLKIIIYIYGKLYN